MTNNLILGYATRVHYGSPFLVEAFPFVISARLHHPNDRIVLLCDPEVPDAIRMVMNHLGVELYPITTESHDEGFHMARRRYREYFSFLFGQECGMVFLSDTRDLFFQGNIFGGFLPQNDFMAFFEEKAQHTLGTEPVNRNWIQTLHGDKALEELADQTVICSGTTLGTRRAMLTYLAYMVAVIESHRRFRGSAADQGHHNYVIRKGLLPLSSLIFPQKNAFVYTFGYGATDGYSFDAEGLLTTSGSSSFTPASVHQYDRLVVSDPAALSAVSTKIRLDCAKLGIHWGGFRMCDEGKRICQSSFRLVQDGESS